MEYNGIRVTGVFQISSRLVITINRTIAQMESTRPMIKVGTPVMIMPPDGGPFDSAVTGIELTDPYDP